MKVQTSLWIMLERELSESEQKKLEDMQEKEIVLAEVAKDGIKRALDEDAIEFIEAQVDVKDE